MATCTMPIRIRSRRKLKEVGEFLYVATDGNWAVQDGYDYGGVSGFQMVPCGKCIDCRNRRAADWALRLMAEERSYNGALFVTLTYAPEHANVTPNKLLTVCKRDVQLFIKRLRKAQGSDTVTKYYCAAEYGSRTKRPHYHLIMFGFNPEFIPDAWGLGTVDVSVASGAAVAYSLKYISKGKQIPAFKGDDRTPEFSLSSKNSELAISRMRSWAGTCRIWLHTLLRRAAIVPPFHGIIETESLRRLKGMKFQSRVKSVPKGYTMKSYKRRVPMPSTTGYYSQLLKTKNVRLQINICRIYLHFKQKPNMRKLIHSQNFDYKAHPGERNGQPSFTRPDMTYTPYELLKRLNTGLPVGRMKNMAYHNDVILPELEKMDLVEKQELMEANVEKITQLDKDWREKELKRSEALKQKAEQERKYREKFDEFMKKTQNDTNDK